MTLITDEVTWCVCVFSCVQWGREVVGGGGSSGTHWGIVSSRVALLLRSAEIKPIVLQICSYEQHLSFYLSGCGSLKGYYYS